MAVSEGLHTSEECKESENALIGDQSDSGTKQKYREKKHLIHVKAIQKCKLALVIGTLLLVLVAITAVVYIIIDISERTDNPRHCNTNIKVLNGRFINAPGIRQGDTANIQCEVGHKLNGSKQIACLSSGHWNETPICLPKQCSKLRLPEYAKIELRHLTHRIEEITVACEAGFVLEGNKTVICHENDTWSKVPYCKPVNCGYPASIKNGIILNLTDTTYNKTFHVLCNHGYYLRGREVVKCESDGTWGELPKCEQVSCGTPIIPKNGHIKKLDERSVTFKCENDFVLVGNVSSKCQISGEWSTYPECKRVCSLDIHIPNGRVLNKAGLNKSHIANIECADKHKLNGSNTIVCQPSGQWNETPICVRKQCQLFPAPPNAEFSHLQPLISNVGEEVTIFCNKGFQIKGNRTSICQDNETWSQIPVCKPVDCGHPLNTNFANGVISRLTDTTYNSTFHVRCNNGYYLNGQSIVRCESDGNWSTRPTCKPVSCGSPNMPENAYSRQTINGFLFGSSVSFQCKKGFSLTGAKSSTCQSDGKWSVPYPKCEQIKEQPVYPKKGNNFVQTTASSSTRLSNNMSPVKIILFVSVLLNWL